MADVQLRSSDATLNRLLAEVSADRLMEYTRTIAQWQRLSGTPEERRAFDYVEQTLRGFGLTTARHAPVCLVSLPGPASLTLLDSGEQPPCITHSFSTATGPDGVTGEVVYLGAGSAADYAGHDVRGKIVLTDGLAGPGKVPPSERAGAAAVINANLFEVHEMIVSPVWGSPTPDKVDQLPTIPHISVDGETGARLKERLARGPLTVRITTEVDTGWRPLPVLVATLPAPTASDEYVLLSGHIDSWYYGAMDNGSANASMLETARILAAHRDRLRRELRVAFWSGHSHARYGTSAWFADEFWQDLHDHCVAHVNIDSPGGVGATGTSRIGSMAEAYGFAREMFREFCGEELGYQRIGRGGDQSFWGVGVPSVCGKIYQQGSWDPRRRDLSGSFGWWWHTADDTMDRIDPANLARDAGILLAATYRVTSDRVLPFDQTGPVDEIRDALGEIAGAAGDALDLAPVRQEADALREATVRLHERSRRPATDAQARRLNRCLVRVSRLLIPVNYTMSGPFGQDPALGFPAVPGLRPAARLAALPAGSPERHLLMTALRRERNRVRAALIDARRAIEDALAATA